MRLRAIATIAIIATALLSGCASGPKPVVVQNNEFDPYSRVSIGPVSYVSPAGTTVTRQKRGLVEHAVVGDPATKVAVRFFDNPPRQLSLDADLRARRFASRVPGGGIVHSIEHSYRGTAESVKYGVVSDGTGSSRKTGSGTLVVLRQDRRTVAVEVMGPLDKAVEVDRLAESLASSISFAADKVPAALSSVMALHAGKIKEEQGTAAARNALDTK